MVNKLVVNIATKTMKRLRQEADERDQTLSDYIRRILVNRELVFHILDEEDKEDEEEEVDEEDEEEEEEEEEDEDEDEEEEEEEEKKEK